MQDEKSNKSCSGSSPSASSCRRWTRPSSTPRCPPWPQPGREPAAHAVGAGGLFADHGDADSRLRLAGRPLRHAAPVRGGDRAVHARLAVLCALSHSLSGNWWRRGCCRGMGGAMLLPVGRLAVLRALPRGEFLQAMSFVAIPRPHRPAARPTLGGWLVQYATWHWIFLINLPVGLIGFFATLKFMPEGAHRGEALRLRRLPAAGLRHGERFRCRSTGCRGSACARPRCWCC
jgi:hypothetical protein